MISPCCSTFGTLHFQKSPNTEIFFGENEENLTIFTIILMAALGSKNVHSALGLKGFKVWSFQIYLGQGLAHF